jgi:hypothetical protein
MAKAHTIGLTHPRSGRRMMKAEIHRILHNPIYTAANRRLFRAYVLREQLDRLWTYKTREDVARFLFGWLKALCWQRLPEMEKLGDTLVNHFDGIAAYADHRVRFGVVESLNTTIKAVLRRARGMRHEAMLLLKLKWATARPIRSSKDLARFPQPQALHSNDRT